jgi:hypothetical protein
VPEGSAGQDGDQFDSIAPQKLIIPAFVGLVIHSWSLLQSILANADQGLFHQEE